MQLVAGLPVIDLTDRVDFHGVCVCYIQAPLSPCCTGVDIYKTCRRGPLDRTNERARPWRRVAQPDTAIQWPPLVLPLRSGGGRVEGGAPF